VGFANKGELKDAIVSHIDDDDLVSQVDDFITLAEARHNREIRIREMLSRAPLTIDDRFIDLPADFLEAKYLRVEIPSVSSGLRFYPEIYEKSIDELTKISVLDEKRPAAFAIHDAIEFDCPPDQDYTGELLYYAPLAALDEDDDSNALLVRAPDAYLYAALSATAPFLLHDERIPTWEALYERARDGLNAVARRRTGPLVARVGGSKVR
jgi:hypothetical protein